MRTRLWQFHLAALTCVAHLMAIGGGDRTRAHLLMTAG